MIRRSRLLLAGLLPATLAAQTLRDTAQLAPTVVTATRVPGLAVAPTATATVLDGAALRAEGVTHVADALRRVPGLAIVRTSSAGSQVALFLRGAESDHVRVLVDGVPVNEPGGTLDLGRLTLDDVERIEVVRGPASVLYGSEAMAGVIQVFTRRGGGAPLRAEVGGGNYGTRRWSLGTDGRSAGWAWTVQGDRHHTDGILPFNNAYRNDGVSASIGTVAGRRSDLRLTGRFNGSTYRYPTDFAGQVVDRNSERVDHRLLVGLDAGHRWSERLETRVQLSSSEARPRTNDAPDGPADTLDYYLAYYSRGVVVRRVADLRTNWRASASDVVTIGLEHARDTERSSDLGVTAVSEETSSFRAARENRALYAQAIGERRRLGYSVGGRVDENSAFGTFRTVRAGASWRLGTASRLRASAGSAFKAPSFFENFASGFTRGNPALRPERAASAELGIETVFGRGIALRATAFQQRFRDLIQYTGLPAGPASPNYYNVAAANAGGLELEAALPVWFGTRALLGYTWTATRVTDAGFDTGEGANFVAGGRLIRRPAHQGSVQLVRPLAGTGTLSLAATYLGDREDRDFSGWPAAPVVLPAVTTVDVGVEWPLAATGGMRPRLQLRADNLLDARYEQVKGFAAPGRTWYMGLKLER